MHAYRCLFCGCIGNHSSVDFYLCELTGVCSMVVRAITALLILPVHAYKCLFFGCRGDHSSADFYLCVLPPKTETVIFSIDGSFTASMSISGKDPKVRPGAVDVVR